MAPYSSRRRANVLVYADEDALGRAAAERIERLAVETVAERGRFVVALSGGTSPRRLYEELADEPYRSSVPWARVHLFWSDERAVAPDDEASNFGVADRALVSRVPICASHVHRIEAEREDLDAACLDYERVIESVLGRAPGAVVPRFDLVLLGLGSDAHTASLFPGAPGLEERKRWVVPSRAPVPPFRRATMTVPLLCAAREVLFIVSGDSKASALARAVDGGDEDARLPARIVSEGCPGASWLVDRAAARLLRGGPGA